MRTMSSGALLLGLLAGAWSVPASLAEEPVPSSGPSSSEVQVADASIAETDAAEAADPIVCKYVEATGSRLRRGKVCKPQSVWNRHQRKADELTDSIERGNSAGIGGDELPPPGG